MKRLIIIAALLGAVVAINVYHYGLPAPYVKPDLQVDNGKPILSEDEVRGIAKEEAEKVVKPQ